MPAKLRVKGGTGSGCGSAHDPLVVDSRRISLVGAGASECVRGGHPRRMSIHRSARRRAASPEDGSNGPETPQSFGAPLERVTIPSDGRILDGVYVRALDGCETPGAVLIFHGVMETVSEWSAAQAFLRTHCVDSLVFDYTGHGNSSPGGSVERVDRDAAAAYAYFVATAGADRRLCVLGHSMGNGPMLDALPMFTPAPSCVVVGNPLSSLRDWGAAHVSSLMRYLIPDVWNSLANVARAVSPILVVHSRDDTVNPIEMGRRVFAAAPEPKYFVELASLRHNALYRAPDMAWWMPTVNFILTGRPPIAARSEARRWRPRNDCANFAAARHSTICPV